MNAPARLVEYPEVFDPTQHWHVFILAKPTGLILHEVCAGGSGSVDINFSDGAEDLVDVRVVSKGTGRRSN